MEKIYISYILEESKYYPILKQFFFYLNYFTLEKHFTFRIAISRGMNKIFKPKVSKDLEIFKFNYTFSKSFL